MEISNIGFGIYHPFNFYVKAVIFIDFLLVLILANKFINQVIFYIKMHKKGKHEKIIKRLIRSKNNFFIEIGNLIEKATLEKLIIDEKFQNKIERLKNNAIILEILKLLITICSILIFVSYLIFLITKQFLILYFEKKNLNWFVSETKDYLCSIVLLNALLILINILLFCFTIKKNVFEIEEMISYPPK